MTNSNVFLPLPNIFYAVNLINDAKNAIPFVASDLQISQYWRQNTNMVVVSEMLEEHFMFLFIPFVMAFLVPCK